MMADLKENNKTVSGQKAKSFERVDTDGRDLGTSVYIYCPGCKGYHSLRIRMPANPTAEEVDDLRRNRHGLWTWNKDVMKPTFTPSLLCNPDHQQSRCHSFITNGQIQFLNDCHHEFRGKTVDLPEIDL